MQSIAFSAYPVGAPIPWPTAVPPSGFIAMIGQSFSAVTYPKLALAYPSLVLPDMRAEFIRGYDNGRGVDLARAILSLQGDAIRNFTGTLTDAPMGQSYAPTGVLGYSITANNTYNTGANNLKFGTISIDASRSVPTAADNRPRNIAYNYIVRAA